MVTNFVTCNSITAVTKIVTMEKTTIVKGEVPEGKLFRLMKCPKCGEVSEIMFLKDMYLENPDRAAMCTPCREFLLEVPDAGRQ